MSLPRPCLAALVLAVLALVAGCDFAPVLDIEVPPHQPAAVINAILAADSVAVVQLGVSRDPYVTSRSDRSGLSPTDPNAVVTLLRDGQPVERLQIRSVLCDGDYDPRTETIQRYECGPYAGTVPVRAGGTYTIRAEMPGLPVAQGTVTLPLRPSISVTEEDRADERRRFRVRVQDPVGRGDRYGVSLILGPVAQPATRCDYSTDPPTCTETTVYLRQLISFSSADPVILAAVREFDVADNTYRFVSVTDDSFDGRTWEFSMTESFGVQLYGYRSAGRASDVLTVQIAALSGDVYQAYQISTFGGQDDENPFGEPVNLPSNVTGGYGLVGGVTLAEVTMPAPPARLAQR